MGSSPGWVKGQVPSATQWNDEFASKADDVPFTGDTGSGGTSGVVPAPPAGSAAAGKFLGADGNWSVFTQQISYQTVAAGSGDTIVAAEGLGAVIVTPSDALESLALILPPSPGDGQAFELSTTHTITTITITAPGATVINNNTQLSANGGVSWRYAAPAFTWYPRYTSMSSSGIPTSTQVTLSGTGNSEPIQITNMANGVGLILTIIGSLTATVQISGDPGFPPTNWNSHDTLVNMTSSGNGNIAFPISAIRLNVSAYSGGSVILSVVQTAI